MDTYGDEIARQISLDKIKQVFRDKGVTRLFVKRMAPNDNSKNQPYLGGGYSALNVIPTGVFSISNSSSNKPSSNVSKIFKASLDFDWLDAQGNRYPAPEAKLILYPQYPEVRLSGFLQGSAVSAGRWMDPTKDGRSEGRFLILGTCDSEKVLGYLAVPNSTAAIELDSAEVIFKTGALEEISLLDESGTTDHKSIVLNALRRIHNQGWIESKRLDGSGNTLPCRSSNCGGYTLEAELGITPNGFSEPDYFGWELKQYGVSRFDKPQKKVITLMTPEPTGGMYKEEGVIPFLRKYGYEDRNGRPDRINFGGVHKCGESHPLTNLTLRVEGYDPTTKILTDPAGGLALRDSEGEVAAMWHFSELIDHWKRKHAQAAYIPSIVTKDPRMYRFGNYIGLGEETDFTNLLDTICNGEIYYDPGIKMEQASSENPKTKRRSQFRIKSNHLDKLYSRFEVLNLIGHQDL